MFAQMRNVVFLVFGRQKKHRVTFVDVQAQVHQQRRLAEGACLQNTIEILGQFSGPERSEKVWLLLLRKAGDTLAAKHCEELTSEISGSRAEGRKSGSFMANDGFERISNKCKEKQTVNHSDPLRNQQRQLTRCAPQCLLRRESV